MSEKEKIAIEKLRDQIKFLKNGYTNSGLPWYSPSDLAKFIGKSRQYWGKLIKQKKLGAHETSSGPIVTTEQLIEFYQLKSTIKDKIKRQKPKCCSDQNYVYCYCGKCKVEDYPLPKDFTSHY